MLIPIIKPILGGNNTSKAPISNVKPDLQVNKFNKIGVFQNQTLSNLLNKYNLTKTTQQDINTPVNQNAVFGDIKYTPISGTSGLINLGGGGAGSGGLAVNQTYSPTSNISTQKSITETITSTYAPITTQMYYDYITNILNSPQASSSAGGQSATPSVTIIPYVTTTQGAEQTAQPNVSTSAEATGSSTDSWVTMLIIAGVVIIGGYFITKHLNKKGGKKKK